MLCQYATSESFHIEYLYGCKAEDEEGQDLTFTTANNNTQHTTTGEFGCDEKVCISLLLLTMTK